MPGIGVALAHAMAGLAHLRARKRRRRSGSSGGRMTKEAAVSVSGADVLDLLQGELAAIETYNQALGKLDAEHDASADLRRIRADHQEAAAELRAFLREFGHDADVSSGAWGAFAKA